jgi:hypothetical protein
VDTPTTMVFPNLLTCMKCGHTAFKMPEDALRLLGEVRINDGSV